MNKTEVLLTRTNTFNGYGRLRPFSWTYEATHEGRKFTNSSLVTIQQVIRSRFPDTKITFVRTWEA